LRHQIGVTAKLGISSVTPSAGQQRGSQPFSIDAPKCVHLAVNQNNGNVVDESGMQLRIVENRALLDVDQRAISAKRIDNLTDNNPCVVAQVAAWLSDQDDISRRHSPSVSQKAKSAGVPRNPALLT
jgi:hypothetical protein